MISIHPYLRNSRSVVALEARAKELDIPLKVRVKTCPKKGILVYWGIRKDRGHFPNFPGVALNPVEQLYLMTDKLRFFKHVGKDTGLVPEWTDSDVTAREWGCDTVARFKTGGSGGEGLVVYEVDGGADNQFPDGAPLYTRYVRKTHEYRLHVFKGLDGNFSVRLAQRKAARRGEDGVLDVKNWKVRNLENGFVFVKNEDKPIPPKVTEVAVKLMTDHFPDLHFCALDIIYHKPSNTALVLEGNTAPGLEGSTVDVYLDYFQEMDQ